MPKKLKKSPAPSFFDKGRTSGSVAHSERTLSVPISPGSSTVVGDADPDDDPTSSIFASFNPSFALASFDPSFAMASFDARENADALEKGIEREEQWKPVKKEWLVMITLAISSLTVALDATILVPVLPTLAVSLDGTANEAFWAGTSYLLTSAVVQPFIAALSDIFGRRELLVPSLILFTISSIICGVAKSFTTLLVGRVIQGVGGGGIITLAQIIYGDIVPLRQRPRYFSLVLAAWAVGTLIGPVIGGVFVEKATWRWCFYMNLPICGLALPMAILFVSLHTERRTVLENIHLVDWVGGFIFITFLTTFLVAVSSGGVDHAWSSWRTIVPLMIGLAGILISLTWEHRYAKNPFLQRSLFPNLSAIATYMSALFQGFILFMGLYYMSFYFTAAKLASPVNTGVKLLPAVIFVLPGSVVVSVLITRLGCYRWAIWTGWAITTVGCGLLILFNEHTSTAVNSTALSIVGLGLGMILSSVNFATQASVVNDTDSGRAAAMYAFMRTLGMTLGVAIGGTIFQNLMKQKLRELGLDEAIAKNAEGFIRETLRNLPANDPLLTSALKAYAHGFRGVFIGQTTIAGFALVASLAIKHFSMDKILESKFSLQKYPEK